MTDFFLIDDQTIKVQESSYIPYYLNKEISEQCERSEDTIHINFEILNLQYFIFIDDPLSTQSITIKTFPNDGNIWKLKDDFEEWRFELKEDSPFQLSPPCKWGLGEMFINLSQWSDDKNDRILTFYQLLALWLIFDYIKPCPLKDQLRKILYESTFIHSKPYKDLALAELDFCRQLYPRSSVAQKAASAEHLWFCMQYSKFLAKTAYMPHSKTTWRQENQKYIGYFQKLITDKALNKAWIENLKPDLSEEILDDWRLDIEYFLIVDAIEIIYANPKGEQDLQFQLKQYLQSQDRFRQIVGHQPQHVMTNKSVQKSSRGRGRPPKSS